jgi:pSer/pThr/pTyr-binding forkhead associated (FHA) protein
LAALPIPTAMGKPALIVRMAGQPDEVFEIEKTETLIGRAPTCDLQIPDDSMSREHAVVLCDGDDANLEDLQSTNGVRVNGKRVRSVELSHGDEIEIGQTKIVFTRR